MISTRTTILLLGGTAEARALAGDELFVVYQPVVDLDTRAVRGFRAARKRFYRQMLCAHAARQTASDDPAS